MKFFLYAAPFVTAILFSGCASIDGDYLGGLVEVRTGSQSKEIANNQTVEVAGDGCGKKTSRYDQTHHSADHRWCANLTLPGGSFSDAVSYEESVPIAVDLAYIRAKRELQFKDPDDTIDSTYNDNTQWDGIEGTYYGVKARYGGPLRQMLWFSDYDLQLEKIDSSNTKIRLNYRVYGHDIDTKKFRVSLLKKIKNIE